MWGQGAEDVKWRAEEPGTGNTEQESLVPGSRFLVPHSGVSQNGLGGQPGLPRGESHGKSRRRLRHFPYALLLHAAGRLADDPRRPSHPCRRPRRRRRGEQAEVRPHPEGVRLERARLKGHPQLGVGLLTGLMKRGFDPAFSMDMPKPEEGVGHAFMRPSETLTDMKTPVVPVLTNCYFAPQITGMRSYQLGKAVRGAIDEMPGDP